MLLWLNEGELIRQPQWALKAEKCNWLKTVGDKTWGKWPAQETLIKNEYQGTDVESPQLSFNCFTNDWLLKLVHFSSVIIFCEHSCKTQYYKNKNQTARGRGIKSFFLLKCCFCMELQTRLICFLLCIHIGFVRYNLLPY